jgi:2-keto-3-deoxy-L-rhamnonate aldolase RhmA
VSAAAEQPAWATRRNRFQEELAAGRPPVAMWVTSPWPAVPEILGAAGIDGVLLDLEHVSHDLDHAERLIVAADAAGISALVRPPGIDRALVSRILDAGAHGIVFPHVDDADDARRAVSCTRHPPAGTRGWGGAHTRHALWQGGYAGDLLTGGGSGGPGVYTRAYVDTAAAGVVKLMLVESARGVANVAEIAAVDGVDGVIFGWGDFAVECGMDASRCREASATVYAACREHGVGVALSAGDAFYPGCFAIAGVDSLLMSEALAAAVTAARAALA